jgi:hypothetical protein
MVGPTAGKKGTLNHFHDARTGITDLDDRATFNVPQQDGSAVMYVRVDVRHTDDEWLFL